MNRNVKRTIALTLALGAVSTVGSMKYTNVFTTAAYASSSDADELSSLELKTSSGDSLNLYKNSSYSNKLSDDLEIGDTYYAKTSANKVVIDSIDGADEDNVRIFKSGSSKAYEVGDDISISTNSKTTLKVRVYEDEYDSDEDYSSSDYNQYTIIVENTDSNDDSADLLGIGLSYGNIVFNPSTTSYSISVPTDAESITVQAVPKDTDDTVKIDETTVDSDDEYKKTISLDSTTNTITIEVSNDDDSKTYTLNISKTLTAGSLGEYTDNGFIGQGMNNGFGGQGMGQGMNTGFGEQGIGQGMSNGFGGQGMGQGMNNGFAGQEINKGIGGQKKIGWIQDNGNWYYFNSNGTMATNTTIDGYKIGANGVWIG